VLGEGTAAPSTRAGRRWRSTAPSRAVPVGNGHAEVLTESVRQKLPAQGAQLQQIELGIVGTCGLVQHAHLLDEYWTIYQVIYFLRIYILKFYSIVCTTHLGHLVDIVDFEYL